MLGSLFCCGVGSITIPSTASPAVNSHPQAEFSHAQFGPNSVDRRRRGSDFNVIITVGVYACACVTERERERRTVRAQLVESITCKMHFHAERRID